MRAVVDANIWISALLNRQGAPAQVLQAFQQGRFSLLVSEDSLSEIAAVLARPRFSRYGIVPAMIGEYVRLLRTSSHLVTLSGEVDLCRDPKDNHLIELAVKGRAEALVSRDEDLTRDLEVHRFLEDQGIRVLTVQRFLAELDPPTG